MCDCEKQPMVQQFPFKETGLGDGVFVRTFEPDVDPLSLVWHWDPEDRSVSAENPNGWKLQLDDQLPIEFPTDPFTIKAGVYHRIIAGNGPLSVRIRKL